LLTYAARRILISIPVLFAVTVVVFLLIEFAPGDIADYFINPEVNYSEESLEAIRERFGLNDPLPVRYGIWISNVIQGDLGYSFLSGEPVAEVVARRFGNTLTLMSWALIIGLALGVTLGIFTAVRQYSFWDYLFTGLSFLGIAMPAFVTGILALWLFAIIWPIFPAGGTRTIGIEPSFFDRIQYMVLPVFVLSLAQTATFMRYTRFSMLDVLSQDYVRTARGKGLGDVLTYVRHALPNALMPVITVIGLSLPVLVVGAVFTETIFSWPGMGTLYLSAVNARDVPLVMGLNLFIAAMVLIANLLTDLAYGLVDPRIRYD